jgi:hypothetical protein
MVEDDSASDPATKARLQAARLAIPQPPPTPAAKRVCPGVYCVAAVYLFVPQRPCNAPVVLVLGTLTVYCSRIE